MRCLLARARSVAVRVGVVAATCSAVPAAAQAVLDKPLVEVRGDRPRLLLTEVRRIGSETGENDAFGRIRGAAIDSRGRVLVADDLNHRVSVFGPDGRFVGHAGRMGQGPGELDSPWRVAVDARDSIFVWDAANSRISVFSPDLRFRRSLPAPPQWLVNSIDFLPDGKLLVSAFGVREPGMLHVLSRTGRVEGTFGPKAPGANLGGFESSLLGGTADVAGGTIVYSNKSPYELRFFDLNGKPRSRCTGRSEWTAAPSSVLRLTSNSTSLEWNRFVHSYNVVGLGNGYFLNQILDPVEDRTYFHLVTSDCRLLRRREFDVPLNLVARSGSRILAVQNLDYPQLIVYDVRVAN